MHIVDVIDDDKRPWIYRFGDGLQPPTLLPGNDAVGHMLRLLRVGANGWNQRNAAVHLLRNDIGDRGGMVADDRKRLRGISALLNKIDHFRGDIDGYKRVQNIFLPNIEER